MKAILLLDGDISSATLFYYLREKGIEIHPVIFKYDQMHFKNMKMARKLSRVLKAKPRTSCVDCACYPFSLTGNESCCSSDAEIKKHIPLKQGIFQNVVFLTMACNYAGQIGVEKIFYAAHQVDRGVEFVDTFNKMVKTISPNISIEAPFLTYSEADIVKLGMELKVPYENTWSCQFGGERPCLKCDGCISRAAIFKQLNIKDPLLTNEEWSKQLELL